MPIRCPIPHVCIFTYFIKICYWKHLITSSFQVYHNLTQYSIYWPHIIEVIQAQKQTIYLFKQKQALKPNIYVIDSEAWSLIHIIILFIFYYINHICRIHIIYLYFYLTYLSPTSTPTLQCFWYVVVSVQISKLKLILSIIW